MRSMPEFVKSPYFYVKDGRWRLRDDAPEELKKEFKKWMERGEDMRRRGILA